MFVFGGTALSLLVLIWLFSQSFKDLFDCKGLFYDSTVSIFTILMFVLLLKVNNILELLWVLPPLL